MRIGAVDLGSSSLKYAVAEIVGDGFEVLVQGERLVRVGEGLEANGYLNEEAIERTVAALAHIREVFEEHEVAREVAVATAGLRGAANSHLVLDGAKRHGFDIDIIEGDEEAELSFVTPARTYGPGPVAVFDVGGRSTEITVGQGDRIENRISLPLGGVRLTERFISNDPPTAEELEAVRAHVAEVLATAPDIGDAKLIGVSGTVLALFGHAHGMAIMSQVLERAEGRRLTVLQVAASLQGLAKTKADERCLGNVIPPRRADVIVAGAIVVAQILAHYRRVFFIASGRGLRYGLLERLRLVE